MSRFLIVVAVLAAVVGPAAAQLAPPARTSPPTGYVAPKGDGPVVELIDEDVGPAVAEIGKSGPAGPHGEGVTAERVHVYAGIDAVRVTHHHQYHARMTGWAYKVVEAPAAPGEFRYLRFAWRKDGGGSVLIAFAINGGQWSGKRYAAGPLKLGGSGFTVAPAAPGEWTVVTRDVFADFGPLTLDGVLLSADEGGVAYFDHVLLGRTVADLDRATDAALGRLRPPKPLSDADRAALWAELSGPDSGKGAAAFRVLLATAGESAPFLADRLPKPDPGAAARVRRLIVDLDADRYAVREKATAALWVEGRAAVAQLRAAADGSESAEVRRRAGRLARALSPAPGRPTREMVTAARVVRILEQADTPPARDLLAKFERGDYGPDYAAEARDAAARAKVTAGRK